MKWVSMLLVILLCACTDNMNIPSDIIQRPRMQKILWDMIQADRFSALFIQSREDTLNRNKTETFDLYDKVFAYNGISRDEFLKSYQFYLSRPDILKVMFDSISAQGERKKAEVYHRPNADSLRSRADSARKRMLPKFPPRIDSAAIKVFPNIHARTHADSARLRLLPETSLQRRADSARLQLLHRTFRRRADSARLRLFRRPPVQSHADSARRTFSKTLPR